MDLTQRVLAFSLADQQYAVPLEYVREVIGANIVVTPVPQSPDHIKGLINLRGTVIPLIDLKSKLKISGREVSTEDAIIIVDIENEQFSFTVDAVNCVISPTPDEISNQRELLSESITGILKQSTGLTLVLNPKATLSSQDLNTIKQQKRTG